MKKGINYWAFPPGEVSGLPGLLHTLTYARDLGYDTFEPTVDGPGAPLSVTSTQNEVEQIRRHAESVSLEIPTVASGLAWGVSPTHPDSAVRAQAVENARSVLQIAAWIGADTILYLPGMVSAVFVPDFEPQQYDHVQTWARESLMRVLETAEKLGITVAVENVWNRFLLSPVEMAEFIDATGSSYVGCYFDTGNAMLYGHPEHWIHVLGARIAAVHVKDFRVNVGNLDGFVDVLAGDVDFAAVFAALESVGYNRQFTIEYVPPTLGAAEKGIAALRILEQQYKRG